MGHEYVPMSRGAYGHVHPPEPEYSRTGSTSQPAYVALRYRKNGKLSYSPSTGLTRLRRARAC